MLLRLYVDNYRCLVNFEFRPTNKQLVIGRNGAGKSTVLDVLSLVRDFSVRGIPCDDRLMGPTKTRWLLDRETQRFELEAMVDGHTYRYELVVDEWGNPPRARVKLEAVDWDGKPVFRFEDAYVHLFNDRHDEKVKFPFDFHRSALATVDARPENKKLTRFKQWLGGVQHVQINPWAMSARSEQESREPAKDLGNFADWFRHLLLDNSAAVHAAVSELRDSIPGLEALDAKEWGLNVRVVQATIRSEPVGKSKSFLLHDLSEGQRALIALYVLMRCALSSDATLLIDEPDNFIALAEIQPWLMKLLDRVDQENAQVILVSHHPELLNQLAGQGAIVFDRTEGGPTRALPFQPPNDTGLTPAEIVARGWERA